MFLFYVLIVAAILLTTIAFLWLCQSIFLPRDKKRSAEVVRRRVKSVRHELNPVDEQGNSIRKSISSLAQKIPLFGMSDAKRYEYEHLLDAVEWRPESIVTPEDVHFQQIILAAFALVITVLLGMLWRPLFMLVFAAVFAYKYPVNRLKKIVEHDLTQINFQFPDFYDTVYVQYRERGVTILMRDIVQSYIPVAGAAFKKMLKRFLIDLDSGEEYAIEALEKRYSGAQTIHRFCSVMKQRFKGDEASFVAMYHFQESLQTEVRDWMMADLDKRKATASTLIGIMVAIILTVVMIVYFVNFAKMAV